jgi:hypothetical protein
VISNFTGRKWYFQTSPATFKSHMLQLNSDREYIYDKGKKINPKIYHDAERSTNTFTYTYDWMYTIMAK